MATTNGTVWALAFARGVVYAGGRFTRMYSNGSHVRNHIGAVIANTGALTSFSPNINGEVTALAVSPGGKVLYVGGSFTAVGKAPRMNVAAFSTVTGKLTNWAPKVVATSVRAIVATAGGIYLGGTIDRVNGIRRGFAAKVSLTGTVMRWGPRLDGWVRAMKLSPDRSRIFLGGGFHHVDGVRMEALASVNLTNGAREPFKNGLIPTYHDGRFSQVTSFTTNGQWMFAGAEGTGHHAFDGTLAFGPLKGYLKWRNTCLGATQAVLILRGVLYKASHAHDCSTAGGFGPRPPGWEAHHLLAEWPRNGKLMRWGTSTEFIPHPRPNTNGGFLNGLGPFAFTTDGRQLFVGGEFTTVNGRPQVGLARFRAS